MCNAYDVLENGKYKGMTCGKVAVDYPEYIQRLKVRYETLGCEELKGLVRWALGHNSRRG